MIAAPAHRNDPCPCGSGQRYKHCHGRLGASVVADAPDADDPAALRAQGQALVLAQDIARARAVWSRVLAQRPGDAEALFHLGNCAQAEGAQQEAIDLLTRARAQAPRHVGVLNNLGLALDAAGRHAEARACYEAALAVAPDARDPLANLAQSHFRERRYDDALAAFDRLLAQHEVTEPALWANRGVCQRQRRDLEAAATSFEQALAREQQSATLWREFGLLNVERRRFDEAAAAFERGLACDPDSAEAAAGLLACRLALADWHDVDALRERQLVLAQAIERNAEPISPFDFLTHCDDPALQGRVARDWVRKRVAPPGLAAPTRVARERLRLGFVSADFYEHPVGRLLVDLVERLDRRRFEVTLYAIGAAPDDALRRRLAAAADGWRAFPAGDDETIATRIRDDAIDVLFDASGLTGFPAIGIFARRPAPLQINCIGFTGTMGSDAYDFIVADRFALPPAAAAHCVERPLHVEPCYLPSDPQRHPEVPAPTRADYGLPPTGPVLAVLAESYKILPEMFAAWLGLLHRHDDAVLWLRAMAAPVAQRLRHEAERQGVAGERVRFAPRDPLPRYLARLPLADLVLDTYPYGAHTSVNDALYMGVPVVTLAGHSFASRASASQLRACGLATLVADDGAGYVAIAARLLARRDELAGLRAALREARASAPLFDMAGYARRFEQAIVEALRATSAAASGQGAPCRP